MSSSLSDDYAAVICPIHGQVKIDRDQYVRQMSCGDRPWRCPMMVVEPMPGVCGEDAEFDENYWEWRHEEPQDDGAGGPTAPR